MPDVLKSFSTRRTPPGQPAGDATAKNAAGGYVFSVDDITRLNRFLVLGSEDGTYYTSAPTLTRENAEVVVRMAENDPVTLVDTITEISTSGRAPRQSPAIFALAIAASAGSPQTRAYALSKLSAVCRTGTHLYQFVGYVEQFRGWGPALKRAVGQWYTGKAPEKLAYQLLKYRQREGWMHRDVLRLARPNPGSTPEGTQRNALFNYLAVTAAAKNEKSPWFGKEPRWDELPALVAAYEQIQSATPHAAISLIVNNDLSWEMLPDNLLTDPSVWEALIAKGLPQTALLRQLPRLTRLGLTTGKTGILIAAQLRDPELLKRGRVHPINVLVAQRTYAGGASARGESTWTPTPRITDALDAAFYAAYGAVEPAGKRILLACDVSGSMGAPVSGLPLSCREAVAALSLVTLNTEEGAEIVGFSDGSRGMGWGVNYSGVCSRLDVSPRRRLDDVCQYMSRLNFGRTDCSLPCIWAMDNNEDFDSIVVLTDNETWYDRSGMHPWQALDAYRQRFGETRYTVVSMTATGTSIANPDDPHSMDIAGFDANVPQVISSFAAGRI